MPGFLYVTSIIANRREDGCETHLNNNITHYLCWSTFIHKSDPSPSRAYCIFAQLTNSNVLEKLPIRDSNNRVNWINCYWWIWQKYNTHVTVKDHIYE